MLTFYRSVFEVETHLFTIKFLLTCLKDLLFFRERFPSLGKVFLCQALPFLTVPRYLFA
jgi:hypothetical protein